MGLFENLRDKYLVEPVVKVLTDQITTNLSKADSNIERWAVPPGFNNQMSTPRKPTTNVTYDQLRNMSLYHDISRACINIRKRQIKQLRWNIMPVDEGKKEKYKEEIPVATSFFTTIGGFNVKMRKLLDLMVEDYLVLDAVTFYKRRTVGGGFLGLIPVDPTTIKIVVDEAGGTPLPPAAAYEQWINGSKVAELTADELIYDMLNPRTNSPYGLSPMESLILTVESSLRAAMFNTSYFADGTMPEGFYQLPDTWTSSMVKEFQEHFDAMTSGDPKMQRRVKFMPGGGSGWQPAKSFDFKATEPYLEWLMRITAAMFGVAPQELGFTDDVNRANGQEQTEIHKRNNMRPMAEAIQAIFTDILQTEQLVLTDARGNVTEMIGPFPDLEFKFLDLDTKDEKLDSEITERMVKIGAKSVDEWRKEQGLEPIGLDHYILTGSGPVLVKDVLNSPKPDPVEEDKGNDAVEEDQEEAMNTTPEQEIKRWEKKALADVKSGRKFRKFESEVLDTYTLINLSHELEKCTSKDEVKAVFATWRKAQEEGVINDATRLFEKLSDLA